MGNTSTNSFFDKVKKKGAEIGNKVKSGLSGFNFNSNGGISIFKKREIIKPYLHSIDSRIINEQVEKQVKTTISDPKMAENYHKFLPSHLINDVYSLYYNRATNLQFDSIDKTNKVKFNILDSINNSLIKIVTNNSHIGSYVYTEEIGKYLYKKFMSLPPEEQEKLKKALQDCNQGEGEGEEGEGKSKGKPGDQDGDDEGEDSQKQQGQCKVDTDPNQKGNNQVGDSGTGMANNGKGNSKTDYSQDALDKMLDSLLNSKQAKKELEDAFKQAEQKLDKLKDIGIDYENSEDLPDNEKNEIISNLNNVDRLKSELAQLETSKEKVLNAVKKILSATTNYYSKKCITKDVELFEAEQLLDINGLEYLHPIFRNSRIFDLDITERKYIGKFDLYVDCSGSMSSGCGGDLSNVQRIVLAKSLAMQMKKLGILGDLYEFEGSPKKINNTEISILMMAARGGTDIEAVLRNILKTGNNSVVLTDGESSIASYTEKALFIGIGCDFRYFAQSQGAGQQFVENDQCIKYNGKDFVVATGSN